MRRSLSVLTLFALALAPIAAQARPIELGDLGKLVRLSSPRISPEGSKVVLVVSRPDYEENRFESRLVLVDIESGASRALTHDRPAIRHPRWSPSGEALAFIAGDGKGEEKKPQVFVLPLSGGEARSVTSAPKGVSVFEWAVDGEEVIYVAAEKDKEEPEGPERHNRSFVVGHHDYLATKPPPASHLWIQSIDGGDPRRVQKEDTVITRGLLAHLAVSPDGRTVAFTGYPADRAGDNLAFALHVVDLETGERKPFENGLAHVSSGVFSPDGRWLAYSRSPSDRPYFTLHNIFLASAGGGSGRKLTGAIDRTFYGSVWMPGSDALIVGGADGARTSLWLQPIDGAPRRLEIGDLQPAVGRTTPDVHVGAKGALAFIASESRLPGELYYMASVDAEPRRLTELNAEVAALDFGKVEEIAWSGPDGFDENGMLIYPPDFDPKKKVPLVLRIHGGPMGSSTAAFDPLGQILAARGWVVFEPNYRGSGNLGESYQGAIIGDAGDGPGRDVMAGIAAVKARGFVDPDRIAVSGWSYGGYMTSWLMGNYPDAWAAAVAGAPVTDYSDQYALSDVNTGFLWGFPEKPWSESGQEIWRSQSPISHLHRAKAPTLILCDTGDLRVPITESYKLYHVLDDHGVPVEFVAYPVPGHFPGDPVHIRDVYRRWGDWIERWFADRGDGAK